MYLCVPVGVFALTRDEDDNARLALNDSTLSRDRYITQRHVGHVGIGVWWLDLEYCLEGRDMDYADTVAQG